VSEQDQRGGRWPDRCRVAPMLLAILQVLLGLGLFLAMSCLGVLFIWVRLMQMPLATGDMSAIAPTDLVHKLLSATAGFHLGTIVAGFGSALVAPRLGRWRLAIPPVALIGLSARGILMAQQLGSAMAVAFAAYLLATIPGATLGAYVAVAAQERFRWVRP